LADSFSAGAAAFSAGVAAGACSVVVEDSLESPPAVAADVIGATSRDSHFGDAPSSRTFRSFPAQLAWRQELPASCLELRRQE
jgi:hypothetical protein